MPHRHAPDGSTVAIVPGQRPAAQMHLCPLVKRQLDALGRRERGFPVLLRDPGHVEWPSRRGRIEPVARHDVDEGPDALDPRPNEPAIHLDLPMGVKRAHRWCRVRVLTPAEEAAATRFAAIVEKYQKHKTSCNYALAQLLEDELLRLEAVDALTSPSDEPLSRSPTRRGSSSRPS